MHIRGLKDRVYIQQPENAPLFSIWSYADLADGHLLVSFGGAHGFDLPDEEAIRDLSAHVLAKAEVVVTTDAWLARRRAACGARQTGFVGERPTGPRHRRAHQRTRHAPTNL
ncbi:hypothetical protein [Saccharopolyspora sp. ASAGF58]|uniref:hypothetical protein n=1 Tax=Saccharopolyspora sp. ASAGF58 TaxID=2719023 RepID=UPI0014473F06|nr:hypothetical protein [Saccharopolyspora sp. ASAGF58]